MAGQGNKKSSKIGSKRGSKRGGKKSSKKGSKKAIIIVDKDVLGKYGYDNIKNISANKRHIALKKALKELKPLSVYRRLIAIATLNKNKDVKLHDILRDDAEWIKINALIKTT
jgi:hypothetical protein